MSADTSCSNSLQPSPEVKALLKEWCKMQEEKYGPDWKKVLAKEMAAKTVEKMTQDGLLK